MTTPLGFIKLTNASFEPLRDPIIRTWVNIEEAMPDPCPNEEAMEACLDADRLESYGGSTEANELVKHLCILYGHGTIIKWACKNLRLT